MIIAVIAFIGSIGCTKNHDLKWHSSKPKLVRNLEAGWEKTYYADSGEYFFFIMVGRYHNTDMISLTCDENESNYSCVIVAEINNGQVTNYVTDNNFFFEQLRILRIPEIQSRLPERTKNLLNILLNDEPLLKIYKDPKLWTCSPEFFY